MTRRKIDVKAIVADIRSGMGAIPIREKHDLDPDEYLRILKALEARSAGPAGPQRSGAANSHQGHPSTKRVRPRGHLLYSVTVQDSEDLQVHGVLNDITEKGLQVLGLPTQPGETRSFLIRSDVFIREPPIVLEAVCRWIDHDSESGEPLAGFEITQISSADLAALRLIVDELAMVGAR